MENTSQSVAEIAKPKGTRKPRAKKPVWDPTGPENEDLLDLFLSKKVKEDVDPRMILQIRPRWKDYDNSSYRAGCKAVRALAKKILKQRQKEKENENENVMVKKLKPYASGVDSCCTESNHRLDEEAKQWFASRKKNTAIVDINAVNVNVNAPRNGYVGNVGNSSRRIPLAKKPCIPKFVPRMAAATPTYASTGKVGTRATATADFLVNIRKGKTGDFKPKNLPEIDGGTTGGTTFNFSPMYLQWWFRDEKLIDYHAVTISLPSGMSTDMKELQKQVNITVSEDGTTLIVKCVRPRNLYSFNFLENALGNQGVSQKTVDAMILGIRSELKEVKNTIGVNFLEHVGCTAKIALKSVCETEIVNRVAVKDHNTNGLQMTVILQIAGQVVEDDDDDSEDPIFYQAYYNDDDTGTVLEVPYDMSSEY